MVRLLERFQTHCLDVRSTHSTRCVRLGHCGKLLLGTAPLYSPAGGVVSGLVSEGMRGPLVEVYGVEVRVHVWVNRGLVRGGAILW